MAGTWSDFDDTRYTVRYGKRAVVEQFAEERFGHPTAWVWKSHELMTFSVVTDPREFRLRLVGRMGEEPAYQVQVKG